MTDYGRIEATLAGYDYALGDCFRCIRTEVQVAHIGDITSPDAVTPLFACRWCIEALVVMHDRAHEPLGRMYVDTPREHPY
ncbi:hypothetical protein [Streptomyces sp. NBC_01190]|uniref:hypothetical protein n=1 Tax=Streptomyces sp. NBC_01190 TaxID=2903767 RepID=UPI003864E81C|nr:hypothetical protein OG519_07360 [Streptomyces sp. NBC_01190]